MSFNYKLATVCNFAVFKNIIFLWFKSSNFSILNSDTMNCMGKIVN